jgi:hypothetical protein
LSIRRQNTDTNATAAALREALSSRGLVFDVEARDKLAVLIARDPAAAQRLTDAEERQAIVALAREHGFTHVALEIAPPAR